MVFNKVDRLTNKKLLPYVASTYEHGVLVSASRGINMSALVDQLCALLEGTIAEETLTFRQDDYDLISQVHDAGEILETRYEGESITLRLRMHRTRIEQIKKSLARKHASL